MSKFITRGLVLVLALVLCMGLIVTANAETDPLESLAGVYKVKVFYVDAYEITIDPANDKVSVKGINNNPDLDGDYTYQMGEWGAELYDATGAKTNLVIYVEDCAILGLPGTRMPVAMTKTGDLPGAGEQPEEPKDEGLKTGTNEIPASYNGTASTFTAPEAGEYTFAIAEESSNIYSIVVNQGMVSKWLEEGPATLTLAADEEIEIIAMTDGNPADDTFKVSITKAGEEQPEEPELPTWTKVEFDAVDWSGTYLIVYEGEEGALIMDGSLDKFDAVNNYVTAEYANGVITGDYKANAFTVVAVEGGYVIQGASGMYMGRIGTGNGMNTDDSVDKFLNTIAYDAEQGILIASSDGPVLRFNSASDQMRFRFFKTSSYTNQQPIALYRLEDGTQLEQKPAEHVWSVIGSIEGTEWDKDFEMTKQEDGTWKSDALMLEKDNELKCRADGAWDLNIGVGGLNGENYVVAEDGVYYVIVDVENMTITLEPVPAVGGPEPISAALAGELDTEFTVMGEILFIDGKNLYIADETGAIVVRMNENPDASWVVGGNIQVTGPRDAYNGLPQLNGCDNATAVFTADATLPTPIAGALEVVADANLCKLVEITGSFEVISASSSKAVIKDAQGNEVTLYKPVETLAVGDTVTKVLGVVSTYNGLQVLSSEIVFTAGEGEPEGPKDPEADTALTIPEAAELGASKDHDNYTAGKYYVTGVITEIKSDKYGNMTITDDKGNTLYVYGTWSKDGETRFDKLENQPKVGDTVKLYGIIGQYGGTAQMKNGWIMEITPAKGPAPTGDNSGIVMLMVVMTISMGAVLVLGKKAVR